MRIEDKIVNQWQEMAAEYGLDFVQTEHAVYIQADWQTPLQIRHDFYGHYANVSLHGTAVWTCPEVKASPGYRNSSPELVQPGRWAMPTCNYAEHGDMEELMRVVRAAIRWSAFISYTRSPDALLITDAERAHWASEYEAGRVPDHGYLMPYKSRAPIDVKTT